MDESLISQLEPDEHRVRLVSVDEVIAWMDQGRSNEWISQEYERRYNITTAPETWRLMRGRRQWGRPVSVNPGTQDGPPTLAPRLDDPITKALIPWRILDQHRWAYPLAILRMEVRRRQGDELTEGDARRLRSWAENLAAGDLVLHYDPTTEEGFLYLPRRPGIDHDLIREPDR